MSEKTKAITVLNATLEWGETPETLEKVIKITGIPATGGPANKVDVSTTEDEIEIGILGRQTIDDLEFDYFYDSDGANFAQVSADSNKQLNYVIKLKGGTAGTIEFTGSHTTYLQEAEGDDPIKGKLVIAISSKPEVKKPAAGAEG